MITTHYNNVLAVLKDRAQLCIVSKKRSEAEIMSYYEAGEKNFAENHAQELVEKAQRLPEDIHWHFIGHLQTNKVRDILPYVAMIQSVDSIRLADTIEKEAAKIDRRISVLAEFHLAEEDTAKTGLPAEEAVPFIRHCLSLPHLDVDGIMVMGPHTDDAERIEEVFNEAYELYLQLQREFGEDAIHILSMGMSDDYRIAVRCGSNMVRIGTYLFTE